MCECWSCTIASISIHVSMLIELNDLFCFELNRLCRKYNLTYRICMQVNAVLAELPCRLQHNLVTKMYRSQKLFV